jgi:hypothetical protein
MMFLDWQFTAQDDEYLDPARYQYREAFILVDAMYRDVPVMWCPYIYVDNDAALAAVGRGGFQRRWATFFRRAPLRSQAPPRRRLRPAADLAQPLGAWSTSCGSLRHLAQAGRKRTVSPQPPTVLLRYFPRLAAGYQDKPAVNELVMSITDNLTVAGAWIGKGELNFPEVNGEELHALAPNRIELGSVTPSLTPLAI